MANTDYGTCFGLSIVTVARVIVGIFLLHWVVYFLLLDKYTIILALALVALIALFGHAVVFNWRPTLVAALVFTVGDMCFHFAKYVSQLFAHGYHYTGKEAAHEAGEDVIYGLVYMMCLAVMAKVLWNLKKFRKYGDGETLMGDTQPSAVKATSPSAAYQEQ